MPRSFALSSASLLLAFAGFAAPWTPQTIAITGDTRGLSVVSPTVVWVSAPRGMVGRTIDGGAHWDVDTVPDARALDFRDIQGFDANTAIAMAAGPAERGQAKMYRTTDGGHTWTVVYSTDTKGVFLDAISFWDRDHGIVMSDPIEGKLYLLRTDDGGATWTHIPSDAFPATLASEGAFAASGTCLTVFGSSDAWIATGGAVSARVFHSHDRGTTWTVAETPVHSGDGGNAGIFSVAFTDAQHGVAMGGNYAQKHTAYDNVALTTDGGGTWRLPKSGMPAGYFSAVAYRTPTELVAVGLGGTALSHDGGESWTIVDSTEYNSAAFAKGTTAAGWSTGPRGRIGKWVGP